MANNVFANGREISCKSASGKAICAFPDVCMTPPENPTTPPGVPIPYPNTGMSSDCTSGSRNVKISNKEVMLKNKSYFKKSMGDEPGSAAKKGVVTSVNRGKVYFTSWSMDVKVEGQNVVRHLDLTTHNHGSVPGNTPTWPYIDSMAFSNIGAAENVCDGDVAKEEENCVGFKPYGEDDPCDIVKYDGDRRTMTQDEAMGLTKAGTSSRNVPNSGNKTRAKGGKPKPKSTKSAQDCLTARACQLVPYQPEAGQAGCCPSQTPHHLVEASSFFETGRGPDDEQILSVGNQGAEPYSTDKAPSICAFGPSQWRGSHGQIHTIQGNMNKAMRSDAEEPLAKKQGGPASVKTIAYSDARDNGVTAAKKVLPTAQCDENCMKAQLDAYHCDKLKVKPTDKIKAVGTGRTSDESVTRVEGEIRDRGETM